MSKPISIGLIGIGGYGHQHLSTLRTLQGAGICKLVAVADPFANQHQGDVAALKNEGVEIYDEAEKLCARENIAAVFIATPIFLHASQTLLALDAGKHVYLEKPPCATLGELEQLLNAQMRAQKICAVGFQMQATPAMGFAKKQISDGAIGKLKTVHASIRWRRDDAYYERAAWAGKWRLGAQPVFDGPATNALAHVVHAAMFLAGAREEAWGKVIRVRGNLKKARAIESYDSSYLEVETETGVQVRLAFTHASGEQDAVVLHCAGENGNLSLSWSGEIIHAPRIGPLREYSLSCDPHYAALFNFFQSLGNKEIEPATTLENTRPYLQAVNGALQSSGGAAMFDAETIQSIGEDAERHFSVAGLDEEFVDFGHDGGSTPSLLKPGAWIEVDAIAGNLIV